MFLSIPAAAAKAGFSVRHFHRLIGEDHLPIFLIGKKGFILTRELTRWQAARAEKADRLLRN